MFGGAQSSSAVKSCRLGATGAGAEWGAGSVPQPASSANVMSRSFTEFAQSGFIGILNSFLLLPFLGRSIHLFQSFCASLGYIEPLLGKLLLRLHVSLIESASVLADRVEQRRYIHAALR